MLIELVPGLVLFLCTIAAYCIGIKHGKELSRGNVPQIPISPVAVVKQYKEHKQEKEEKAQVDKVNEGWANIMSYDGTPQE